MRGIRMLAPPSPVREPIRPTGMEIKRRENMSRATGYPDKDAVKRRESSSTTRMG
jgi:hypothetical protein